MAEGCVMVAPGVKGSFPSSTDDATKPKNIIALSNPHTRTTGFQGTRMHMADLRGRRAAYDYLHCTGKRRRLFVDILPESLGPEVSPGREKAPQFTIRRRWQQARSHTSTLDAFASRRMGKPRLRRSFPAIFRKQESTFQSSSSLASTFLTRRQAILERMATLGESWGIGRRTKLTIPWLDSSRTPYFSSA